MIVGIIVSIAGLGVACMGMKCTTCGGGDKLRKSRIAMTGGIILLVGGEHVKLSHTSCRKYILAWLHWTSLPGEDVESGSDSTGVASW